MLVNNIGFKVFMFENYGMEIQDKRGSYIFNKVGVILQYRD